MEVLLKKYFWVVNLVVIGICAGFAGRAAAHILEGAYLAGDDVKAPARRAAPPPVDQGCTTRTPTRSSSATSSARAACRRKRRGRRRPTRRRRTSATEDLAAARAGLDDGLPERRELVDGGHPRPVDQGEGPGDVSTAGSTIGADRRDGRSRDARSASTSATAAGSSTSSSTAPRPPPAPPTRRRRSPPPALDPSMGDIDKGVNCSGNDCTVDRALVEKLLSEHHHAGDGGALRAVDQGRQAERLQALRDPAAARSSARSACRTATPSRRSTASR